MTDPHGGPPSDTGTGSYVFAYGPSKNSGGQGSVSTDFNNWTNSTIKAMLNGTNISAYTNAQTTAQTNIQTPINNAQSTASTAQVAAGTAQTTANSAVATGNANSTAIASLQASQVTPAYVSLSLTDLATFPRVMLQPVVPSGSYGGSATVTGSMSGTSSGSFSGTVSGSSCSGSYSGSANVSGTLSGSTSTSLTPIMPSQYPTKGVIDFTPIVVDRQATSLNYLKVITGDVSFWGSIFPLTNWLLGLYVYNPGTGNLTLAVNLGDQSGAISNHAQEYAFSLSSYAAPVPGSILFVAQVQNASSSQTRSIAALAQPGIAQAATTTLKASSFTYSSTTLPSSVALSSLTNNNSYIPWAAITTS